jgi:outer membrane protein TolC
MREAPRRARLLVASRQVAVGTSPDLDALRAKVELQTRERQLIQVRNDFAIQKPVLARAYASRSDCQVAMADVRPVEFT